MSRQEDGIAEVINPQPAGKRAVRTAINQHGFTLIEVVVVLIVLFIVTTVVVSRSFTTGTNELMVETDGLKASLRFAQIQSLAAAYIDNNGIEKGIWGIHFPDATSYTLYKDGEDAKDGSGVVVMIPVKGSGGDPVTEECPKNCHRLQGGVQITSPSPPMTISFDIWGRPKNGVNLLGADFSIILGQGAQTGEITITRNTGYIP